MTVSGYKQTAEGTFIVRTAPGTPHCGVTEGVVSVAYRVEVVYHPGALDSNGFLLDNTWFRDYFAQLKDVRLSISCEKLAETIAGHLCSELAERLCACDAIHVALSAVPGVWIEAVCQPHHAETAAA